MPSFFRRALAFRFPVWSFPLALLGVSILAYGLLIPWLGFSWDDWAFAWISQQLGTEGLARYFSTNRPLWGLIYQFSTALLGGEPWRWQVFGLFWRWASAAVLWWTLRLLWPRRSDAAAWVSLLFLLYPGFDQQFIAITYGHMFLVLTCYFLSLAFMLLALRKPGRFWLFSLLALLFSLVNLLALEYFFLLELLRPVIIWVAQVGVVPVRRRRVKVVLGCWLPYLILFIAVIVWRLFFFQYQTHNYSPLLVEQVKAAPLATLWNLVKTAAFDWYKTSFMAWGLAFTLPSVQVLGRRTTQVYWLVSAASAAGMALYLTLLAPPTDGVPSRRTWAVPALVLGALGLLLAGGPFWLTNLPVGLVYLNSRFALPFIMGASFLLAGLLGLIPGKSWIKTLPLALVLGLAVGYQFQVANAYRRDWNLQKTLFWQLAWRAPQLQGHTALLSNVTPIHYSSDNSLTAPLNWMYDPDNHSDEMRYYLFYPAIRGATGLKNMQPGQSIHMDYLAAAFDGTTDQTVAFVFSPPACLRVLQPDLDVANPMLPLEMRKAAVITFPAAILPPVGEGVSPPQVYGAEPAHGWCYYFELADLARQQGDWQQVTALGDVAFTLDDHPNDPAERVPFIEGYARVGNWQRAVELTRDSAAVTTLIQPMLCRLWQRIDDQAPASVEKDDAVAGIIAELECGAW